VLSGRQERQVRIHACVCVCACIVYLREHACNQHNICCTLQMHTHFLMPQTENHIHRAHATQHARPLDIKKHAFLSYARLFAVLLEDVAVPVRNLAKLCRGITAMFEKFGYHDGSAFGHALEGNLHLVFTQGFETPAQVCGEAYDCLLSRLTPMICPFLAPVVFGRTCFHILERGCLVLFCTYTDTHAHRLTATVA
jgi:hypothetical protein